MARPAEVEAQVVELRAVPYALSVAWIGDGAFRGDDAAQLDGFAVRRFATVAELERSGIAPQAIHVAAPGLLGRLRGRFPHAALVLDLAACGGARLGLRARRDARLADAIVVDSPHELRELRSWRPELAARASLVRRPIDLDAHAPLDALKAHRDTELKRFRRFHRLTGPMVLFAGPYTEEGGLDRLVECVLALHERLPDLRLAAIPEGRVDQRYLDRCERRAMALGHHGMMEWTRSASEAPLWYALASVVCLPCRAAVSSDAAAYAAAAARPFLGSNVAALADDVADGRTGRLVPQDGAALESALETLLADTAEATRLGEAARARVEQERSPLGVSQRLARVWHESVSRRGTVADERVALEPGPQAG